MARPLSDVWDEHQACEFASRDADATMATMVRDDRVHVALVPSMAGGAGRDGVREFYARDFIPAIPPDMAIALVSRTVGDDQLVDELIVSFTHTIEMPWILPGVPPTGRRVEVAIVIVVRLDADRVLHEHIYWDQASVLRQVGLLGDGSLPAFGAEAARRVTELAGLAGA